MVNLILVLELREEDLLLRLLVGMNLMEVI